MTAILNQNDQTKSQFFSSIDLTHTHQTLDLGSKLHAKAWKLIGKAVEILPIGMRFLAPIVAFNSVLIKLATRVAHIGEILFKGFANIFGALFIEEARILKGVKQILFDLPATVLMGLIETPINFVAMTVGFAIDPSHLSGTFRSESMITSEERINKIFFS